MASIEKIKQAVDKETTQPVSYADLIAIVPHLRRSVQKGLHGGSRRRRQLRVLVHRDEPVLGARCALDALTLPKPIRVIPTWKPRRGRSCARGSNVWAKD